MAGFIYYKEEEVIFNNRQFNSAITFASRVARKIATTSEMSYVEKMEDNAKNYWPGMCFDIEKDFLELEEKKFWAIVFYEVAREIFERKIGDQTNSCWQTQRIHQMYATALVFQKSVRATEPKWVPDTRDYREFNDLVKNRNT